MRFHFNPDSVGNGGRGSTLEGSLFSFRIARIWPAMIPASCGANWTGVLTR